MRRILLSALIAAASLGGIQTASAQELACDDIGAALCHEVLAVLDALGCHGSVNVCQTSGHCQGDVNVCPNAGSCSVHSVGVNVCTAATTCVGTVNVCN